MPLFCCLFFYLITKKKLQAKPQAKNLPWLGTPQAPGRSSASAVFIVRQSCVGASLRTVSAKTAQDECRDVVMVCFVREGSCRQSHCLDIYFWTNRLYFGDISAHITDARSTSPVRPSTRRSACLRRRSARPQRLSASPHRRSAVHIAGPPSTGPPKIC